MAKFRVTMKNIAGVLDQQSVESEVDSEEGLPFSKFMFLLNDMLNASPLHDGDSFTVELLP